MDNRTPSFWLADILLPGGVEPFVVQRRAAGKSWRRIALDIRDATDKKVDLTHETLRAWFIHTERTEAAL